MSWFEYSQFVLERVRFDRRLFRKELRKFLHLLSPTERHLLIQWCRSQWANKPEMLLK